MGTEANFVKEIESGFYSGNDETVFESLFREYERVVFKSIITAFGLDGFIMNQHGGDVDTVHNVRMIGTDSRMKYKSGTNAEAYEARGDYSHKDVEGPETNFRRIKHEARKKYGENPRENTVQDAYEDKPLGFLGHSKGHPTDKSAELDHVIAAKTIHDDRGRVLAGITTAELADAEDNLRWTNEHLNKSMGADEIPDFIEKHPELSDDEKSRMMDAYNQAKASYEKKIFESYYFDFSNPQCRSFYRETALAAGKRGLQMGLRQVVGFLITELWFDVKDELKHCNSTFVGAFDAIKVGLKKWAIDIKENYKGIIAQFGEGIINGIVSSLTTTLANIFVTTSQNVVRIIRQVWASVVEAAGILFFNTKEKYFCDRMTSAAKVLAAGASMVIGSGVQQLVLSKLSGVGLPNEIVDIVSVFAGSLSTGFLAVSLLFYIDNDPFAKFLDTVYGAETEELKRQGKLFRQFCSELEKIDTCRFDYETRYVYQLSLELDSATDDFQANSILRRALSDLGLPLLWGEGSLFDRLKSDPDWTLNF